MMDVKGLTISHVKSHLQMYRGSKLTLGKPEESSSSSIRRRQDTEEDYLHDYLSLHTRNDCLTGFHPCPHSSLGGVSRKKQTSESGDDDDVDDFLHIMNMTKMKETSAFPSHHFNETRWPVDGMLRRWGRRLPKLQRNVRSAPNFSDAAMGSIAHRTKVSVRRQKFTREICHGETFSVTRFAITGERIAVVSLRIYLALHHLKGFVSTMFLKGDGNKAEEFRKRKKKELNAVEHVVREEKTVGGYELSGIYSVLYGCAAYIWAAIFSPLIVVKARQIHWRFSVMRSSVILLELDKGSMMWKELERSEVKKQSSIVDTF
ncbi:hypothetical protein Bca52824_030357 [Brassica carinata]|uniref:Uncharacterized protein n=1 Tax=Brassica carinata TaxID=52824 RepID=A0A8X7S8S0_BRACI|nr:hypothetical protein Bca52824_030357 [Brassica carinata]